MNQQQNIQHRVDRQREKLIRKMLREQLAIMQSAVPHVVNVACIGVMAASLKQLAWALNNYESEREFDNALEGRFDDPHFGPYEKLQKVLGLDDDDDDANAFPQLRLQGAVSNG